MSEAQLKRTSRQAVVGIHTMHIVTSRQCSATHDVMTGDEHPAPSRLGRYERRDRFVSRTSSFFSKFHLSTVLIPFVSRAPCSHPTVKIHDGTNPYLHSKCHSTQGCSTMAEAVGTTAAVLQLASTINDIWQFYQNIKDAPKEICALRDSLATLKDMLGQIEVAFCPTNAIAPALDSTLKDVLDKTLKSIRSEMTEFSVKMPLDDKSKGLKERVKWVMRNKKMAEDITCKIQSHKSTLSLILQMVAMWVLHLYLSDMSLTTNKGMQLRSK
jgi:hypothetical protein